MKCKPVIELYRLINPSLVTFLVEITTIKKIYVIYLKIIG